MLKQFYKTLVSKKKRIQQNNFPEIIQSTHHCITRNKISKNALNVIFNLQSSGYKAYIVGGAVRDLLLGKKPKDFDIATNARPEQIKSLFKRSKIIGRRFKIVHVRFGREIIEVTTFRGSHDPSFNSKSSKTNSRGMLLRDNVYGTLHDDALRRDFTVNALYYNADDLTVIDHLSSITDLNNRKLKIIGEAKIRYEEDPVRILRAIRLSIKLGFSIDQETARPIKDLAPLLKQVSNARLFDEVLKLLLSGNGKNTFILLRKYNVFEQIFPQSEKLLNKKNDRAKKNILLLTNALSNTDDRIHKNKPVTPAFLFAVLLWPTIDSIRKEFDKKSSRQTGSFQLKVQNVIEEQLKTVAIPKRFITSIKDIWYLQRKLETLKGKKAIQITNKARFRAAFDFFILRAELDENLKEKSIFWRDLQENASFK